MVIGVKTLVEPPSDPDLPQIPNLNIMHEFGSHNEDEFDYIDAQFFMSQLREMCQNAVHFDRARGLFYLEAEIITAASDNSCTTKLYLNPFNKSLLGPRTRRVFGITP